MSLLDSFMDGRKDNKSFMVAEIAENLDTPDAYETGKLIGRVRLHIPGICDEIAKEELPWAYQMTPVGSGTHEGVGSFRVPAVGTKVICQKLDNHYGWVVLGELNTINHNLEDYHDDYPETWGMRDKTGNKSVINMFKKFAHFTHSSGTNILIEDDGDTTATVVKDLKILVTGFGYHKYEGEYLWDEVLGYNMKNVTGYSEKHVAEYGIETYGEDWTKKVWGKGYEWYGGSYSMKVDSTYALNVSGVGVMNFGQNLYISAPNITLTATGTITLNAPLVNVNG